MEGKTVKAQSDISFNNSSNLPDFFSDGLEMKNNEENESKTNPTSISVSGRMGIGVYDLKLVSSILDYAFEHIPFSMDSIFSQPFQSSMSYSSNIPPFPSKPIPDYESFVFFSRLSLDTLFFIFYYQQGSYQQYLAARTLKTRKWFYNEKLLMWFKPQQVEQDNTHFDSMAYSYFEANPSWMIKNDYNADNDMCHIEERVLPWQITPET